MDTVWIITFDSCDESGECREVAFVSRTEVDARAALAAIAPRFNATLEPTARHGRPLPRGGWHGGASTRKMLAR